MIYQLFDTRERGRTAFWKGPGRWEVRARMVEKGPDGELELSTTKTWVTVFEPEPKAEERAGAPASGAPGGAAGQRVGGWGD